MTEYEPLLTHQWTEPVINMWCPFGGGPFVPVPKKWLLAYQPEERKRRSVSDLVGKLYELDQLEFSFPPAGVFQTSKRR